MALASVTANVYLILQAAVPLIYMGLLLLLEEIIEGIVPKFPLTTRVLVYGLSVLLPLFSVSALIQLGLNTYVAVAVAIVMAIASLLVSRKVIKLELGFKAHEVFALTQTRPSTFWKVLTIFIVYVALQTHLSVCKLLNFPYCPELTGVAAEVFSERSLHIVVFLYTLYLIYVLYVKDPKARKYAKPLRIPKLRTILKEFEDRVGTKVSVYVYDSSKIGIGNFGVIENTIYVTSRLVEAVKDPVVLGALIALCCNAPGPLGFVSILVLTYIMALALVYLGKGVYATLALYYDIAFEGGRRIVELVNSAVTFPEEYRNYILIMLSVLGETHAATIFSAVITVLLALLVAGFLVDIRQSAIATIYSLNSVRSYIAYLRVASRHGLNVGKALTSELIPAIILCSGSGPFYARLAKALNIVKTEIEFADWKEKRCCELITKILREGVERI